MQSDIQFEMVTLQDKNVQTSNRFGEKNVLFRSFGD